MTAEVVNEVEGILPASSHEEVEVILRYLNQDGIRIVEIEGEWSSPVFGSGAARHQLEKVRETSESHRYKEDFANSFDRATQRSTN